MRFPPVGSKEIKKTIEENTETRQVGLCRTVKEGERSSQLCNIDIERRPMSVVRGLALARLPACLAATIGFGAPQ